MRRVLCYGDSNTFGYNPHSFWGAAYPDDVRWTGILRSHGWDVSNCGQNGREIPSSDGELLAVERLIASAMPIDFIVILLGTNDFLNHPHFTAENVRDRMEKLLRRILSCYWNLQIVLVSPTPLRDGAWVQDPRILTESVRLAPRLRILAETLGVAFADAGAWNIAIDFDGVHFRPEGHATFARRLLEVLERQAAQSVKPR